MGLSVAPVRATSGFGMEDFRCTRRLGRRALAQGAPNAPASDRRLCTDPGGPTRPRPRRQAIMIWCPTVPTDAQRTPQVLESDRRSDRKHRCADSGQPLDPARRPAVAARVRL
jgi:hypothetical protein